MTKYIVKTTSYATENNKNFSGKMIYGLYGKNQKLLEMGGSYAEERFLDFGMSTYMLREYGYNRECDAKKSWIYKNHENTEYWKSTAEIIAIEC